MLAHRKYYCLIDLPDFQHGMQVNNADLGAYVVRGLCCCIHMLIFNPTSITLAFGRCLIRPSKTVLPGLIAA
jgi:hypothetical protein